VKPKTHKIAPSAYLAESEYRSMVSALHVLSTVVAVELHRVAESDRVRVLVIRNFIARAQVSLESILRLYHDQAYGDCWALFRTLVDRVFYLHMLDQKDEFAEFERWSFVKQYETNNNVWSDTSLAAEQKTGVPKPSAKHKARYKKLKNEGVAWREPKPEDAAKSLDMMFLYKFGYDVASRFLHPLATDGAIEFEYVAQVGAKGGRCDQRVRLHDACLVVTLLLSLAVNAARRQWRSFLFDAVEDVRKALTGKRFRTWHQ